MQLYTYYRSTSSYRVRIALALKGLAYDALPVNLLKGEQGQAAYRAVNPQGRVPTLWVDDNPLLQSSAIIEYLEERWPQPALLPTDLMQRAQIRGVAAIIGADIHPLHNVAVLNRLRQWGHNEAQIQEWIGHWISEGLGTVEVLLGDEGFCFGEQPGLADLYLIPQVYAAERFAVSMAAWPRIRRVVELAATHPAFIQAHPSAQADAT